MKLNSEVSLLRSAELFEGLSPSACQTILSASDEEVFYAGQQIFREGEPKQKIFLLKEGCVKVSQLSPRGDEAILWLNVPGEVIGSLTYLNDCEHSSTALALQSCRVVMWKLPAFETMLHRFPVLLRNVGRILERQVAQMSSRICEISTAQAEFRLARTLIRMVDRSGQRVDGHVEVNLSQELLGLMIGTTHYTVNNVLRLWERQGLVFRGRCHIAIRDMARLKNLRAGIRRPAYAKATPPTLVPAPRVRSDSETEPKRLDVAPN